jgi:hypothetical protein
VLVDHQDARAPLVRRVRRIAGDVVGLAPVVDRTLRQLLQPDPRDVRRRGPVGRQRQALLGQQGAIGRRIGLAHHQAQHVDAMIAQLRPEPFGEDQVERLAGRIGRQEAAAAVAGAGVDQQHAAAPPRAHRPGEVVAGLQRRHDVALGEIDPVLQIVVEEPPAVGVGAGVVDVQPDLPVAHRPGDLLDRVELGQVDAGGDDLDPALVADFAGELRQRSLAPGEQDQVQALRSNLPGEFAAGAFRGAGDDRPRPVAFDETHLSVPPTAFARRFGCVSSRSA